MNQHEDVQYGRYFIRTATIGEHARATAFADGVEGPVAQAEGDTPDEAIEVLCDMLDRRDGDREAARRKIGKFTVPTTKEYGEAWATLDLAPKLHAMALAHAAAGDAGMTAVELAAAAGYPTPAGVNLQYGMLGREIADALDMDLPKTLAYKGADAAIGLVGWKGEERPDGSFVWVMHPELRKVVA